MEAAPGVELREQRPPFWTLAFSLLVGALACLAGAHWIYISMAGVKGAIAKVEVGPLRFDLIDGQILAALAGFAATAIAVRWILRRRPPRVVRLTATGLLLRTVTLRRTRIVAYSEVESVALQRVWFLRRTFLSLGFRRGGPTILSERRFGPPERLRAVRAAILDRLATSPTDSRERGTVDERSRSDERPLGIPWLSVGVALVTGGLHWATSGFDPLIDRYHWAFTKGLVATGDLYQAATANWLHGSLYHLAWNVSLILCFGCLGERLLGWRRMLGIGMASGVVGFLATLVPMRSFGSALGASAWLFGWLGSWLWLRARHGSTLPPLLQSRGLTFAACFSMVVSWSGNPAADVAHGAGLVTGIAATAFLTRGWTRSRIPVSRAAGRSIVWTSAVVLLAAIGWGMVDIALEGEQDSLRVLQWMLDEADPASQDPVEIMEALNAASWRAAVDPGASHERLHLAERAASWAVELAAWASESRREVNEAAYLDTLATVRYRLGDFDSAVELAWRAVALEREPDLASFHRTQAARFELRRARTQGEAPGARLVPALDRGILRLSIDGAPPGDLTVHAVALRDGGARAHIRVKLPAASEPDPRVELSLGEADVAALEGCDEIVTTLADARVTDAPGERTVEVHELLLEVLRLP